jgi:uncharacterized SAM-binding protein YcdF (DUF218 family)
MKKWMWRGICFTVFLVILFVISFYEKILVQAAYFMAPQGTGKANIAILEGDEGLERGTVNIAMNMMSSGRVSRIVIVIHQRSTNNKEFVLDENYPDLVRNKLKAIGLSEKQFLVVVTPVNHPITLTEATMVLEKLSKEGVHDALLLSRGFHTRRSYLVYQYVGQQYEITVIPVAYFNDYQLYDWWTYEEGLKDFVSESIKLFYYYYKGYISMKNNSRNIVAPPGNE